MQLERLRKVFGNSERQGIPPFFDFSEHGQLPW
jgi:hypothetical protein